MDRVAGVQHLMEFVPVTAMSKPDLGPTQHAVGAISPGTEQQRYESDHLPLTFDKFKNV
jgi:hypothetical protein